MKNKLKTTLIILAIIVLCLSVGVYAATVLSATDVTYTKSDGSTISVKAALDELHAKMPISVTATNIGDEVTVGGEQFYVLSFNDYDRTVNLIAKYNLNTAGTAQQNASNFTTRCRISSTNYWGGQCDLNDCMGFTSTDALGKAKNYARSKGALSGRLMSLREASELQTKAASNEKIETMLWGKTYTTDGFLQYYVGAALNDVCIYVVYGDHAVVSYERWDHQYYYYGVRPVISVLKSSIS